MESTMHRLLGNPLKKAVMPEASHFVPDRGAGPQANREFVEDPATKSWCERGYSGVACFFNGLLVRVRCLALLTLPLSTCCTEDLSVLPPMVVDCHLHLFSSSDLLVGDFLQESMGLQAPIAELVQTVIRFLEGDPDKLAANQESITDEQAEWLLQSALQENQELDPTKYFDASEDKGLGSWSATAIRAVKWAFLITRETDTIVSRYLGESTGTSLSIVLPMDMAYWYGPDAIPRRSFDQQIEQLARVAREHPGRFAPFYHFNPRRWITDSVQTMRQMEERILKGGFLGVKLYPPLGYLPEGNERLVAEGVFKDGVEARQIDAGLAALYEFCATNDVPLATHCEDPGAETKKGYGRFANPVHWGPVLDRFEARGTPLRLCFLHFGGEHFDPLDEKGNRWPLKVFELMKKHPHVYADTGAFAWYEDEFERYLSALELMSLEPGGEVLIRRIMLGSDWHMTVRHPRSEEFVAGLLTAFRDTFGEAVTAGIAGGNALRFLGLTGGKNRERWTVFYGDDLPDWWPEQ
jgi:predicted TIM-barrel fold metal-dependent hydrolase